MAYEVYLGRMLLPVTPSKIQMTSNSKNTTMTLVNEGEISLLKTAGLTTVSFDALFPNVEYPFAVYKKGFVSAQSYLEQLEALKGTVFYFKIVRQLPGGTKLHSTELQVTLEDYTVQDSADQGFDTVVSIQLRQYRSVGTKIITLTTAEDGTTTMVVVPSRDSSCIGIGSTVVVTGTVYSDYGGTTVKTTMTKETAVVQFIYEQGSCPYHIATTAGAWIGWVAGNCLTEG